MVWCGPAVISLWLPWSESYSHYSKPRADPPPLGGIKTARAGIFCLNLSSWQRLMWSSIPGDTVTRLDRLHCCPASLVASLVCHKNRYQHCSLLLPDRRGKHTELHHQGVGQQGLNYLAARLIYPGIQ